MLHIGTTGSETQFLAENELPESFRLTISPEEEAKAIAESTREMEEQEIKDALEKSARDQGWLNTNVTTRPLRLNIGSILAGTSSSGSANRGASSSSAGVATVLPSDNFTEEVVTDIVSMGFPRERAIAELRSAKGNKTQAVAALFAKSLRY